MPLTVVRDELPATELLARLRAGDERPLTALYRQHRLSFLKWAAHFHPALRVADLIDAYQDAILAFYENVTSGKLTVLTVEPRTYLFVLGHRRCVFFEKKLGQTVKVFPGSAIKGMEEEEIDDFLTTERGIDLLSDDPFGLLEQEEDTARRHDEVARALRQLPPDCHRLLTAVYYENQPTASLIETFGYRDSAVLYARKSQCLARLRSLFGISKF